MFCSMGMTMRSDDHHKRFARGLLILDCKHSLDILGYEMDKHCCGMRNISVAFDSFANMCIVNAMGFDP